MVFSWFKIIQFILILLYREEGMFLVGCPGRLLLLIKNKYEVFF